MESMLAEYGLFLVKCLTIAVISLLPLALLGKRAPGGNAGKLVVDDLSLRYEKNKSAARSVVLTKKEFAAERKAAAKAGKNTPSNKALGYVLKFDGDMMGSQIELLSKEVTALISVARPGVDKAVVLLRSGGGLVHSYGLGASQLQRIKDAGIELTVCVDEVAASGGYLMACVADTVIAAPFALVGSIGVVAQVPNINRLLKKNDIDVELVTAGQHKRTLTLLGENTDEGRAKFQEQINDVHTLFKDFLAERRPSVDISRVATGEAWYGKRAHELDLIDRIQTSDDYLMSINTDFRLIGMKWEYKKTVAQKLGFRAEKAIERGIIKIWEAARKGAQI